jgi:hypothetical protein
MSAEPEVIATASRGNVVFLVAVVLGFGTIVAYFWYDAAGDWESFTSSLYRRWALPTLTFLYLSMLPLAARVLSQILLHGQRIVWIEKGQLIYYHPSHFSVPCKDIAALLPAKGIVGRDAIAVITRDGGRKEFAAFGMSISRDEIIRRLRNICGLPDSAPEQTQEI